MAFAVLASCGGTAERNKEDVTEVAAESAEAVVVDYDSLFAVMDVRYNALCAERRRELIEANDRACQEFDDSLQRFIKEYNRE